VLFEVRPKEDRLSVEVYVNRNCFEIRRKWNCITNGCASARRREVLSKVRNHLIHGGLSRGHGGQSDSTALNIDFQDG
jgi:hypothetical protein